MERTHHNQQAENQQTPQGTISSSWEQETPMPTLKQIYGRSDLLGSYALWWVITPGIYFTYATISAALALSTYTALALGA